MSLSVAVHKDIGEYTEKVVGKLSLRTLVCVVGASRPRSRRPPCAQPASG